MNDRPTAKELLAAAQHFLERELIPTLTDARLRFQTLVAANVLGIVERELLTEETHLLREWQEFAELLDLPGSPPPSLSAQKQAVRQANEQLCRRIHEGAFDEPAQFLALLRQVRAKVERKLEVANPRYLAGFSRGGQPTPQGT